MSEFLYGYELSVENDHRVYIGVSNDVARRSEEHKKYGPLRGRDFTVRILKTGMTSNEAREWEISEISRRGIDNLFNRAAHGGQGVGNFHPKRPLKIPEPFAVEIDDRFIPLPEVCLSTGLSRPTIYRGIDDGTFPKPVKYGRSSLWPESEVRKWKDELKEGRVGDDERS